MSILGYGSIFDRYKDVHSLQIYTKYLTLHLDKIIVFDKLFTKIVFKISDNAT